MCALVGLLYILCFCVCVLTMTLRSLAVGGRELIPIPVRLAAPPKIEFNLKHFLPGFLLFAGLLAVAVLGCTAAHCVECRLDKNYSLCFVS